MKKGLLLIVGILLILLGCTASVGQLAEFFEGSSEEQLITETALFIVGTIAPISGGGFLCRRALSQRMASGFLLIVGIVLILLGCVIAFGTAIGYLEGSSKEHVITNIVGFIMLGIVPIAGGGFLCWWALSQRSSGVE